MAVQNPNHDYFRVCINNGSIQLADLKAISANADQPFVDLSTVQKVDVMRRIYLDRGFAFSDQLKEDNNISWFGRAVLFVSRTVYSWACEDKLVRMTQSIVKDFISTQHDSKKIEVVNQIVGQAAVEDQSSKWLTQEQIQGAVNEVVERSNRLCQVDDAEIRKPIMALLKAKVQEKVKSEKLPAQIFDKVFKNHAVDPSVVLSGDYWPLFNRAADLLVEKRQEIIDELDCSDEEKERAADQIIQQAVNNVKELTIDNLSATLDLEREKYKTNVYEFFVSKLDEVSIPGRLDEKTREDLLIRIVALKVMTFEEFAIGHSQSESMDDAVSAANEAITKEVSTAVEEFDKKFINQVISAIRDRNRPILEKLPVDLREKFERQFSRSEGVLRLLSFENRQVLVEQIEEMYSSLSEFLRVNYQAVSDDLEGVQKRIASNPSKIEQKQQLTFFRVYKVIEKIWMMDINKLRGSDIEMAQFNFKDEFEATTDTSKIKYNQHFDNLYVTIKNAKFSTLKDQDPVLVGLKKSLERIKSKFEEGISNFDKFDSWYCIRESFDDRIQSVEYQVNNSKNKNDTSYVKTLSALRDKTLPEASDALGKIRRKLADLKKGILSEEVVSAIRSRKASLESWIQELSQIAQPEIIIKAIDKNIQDAPFVSRPEPYIEKAVDRLDSNGSDISIEWDDIRRNSTIPGIIYNFGELFKWKPIAQRLSLIHNEKESKQKELAAEYQGFIDQMGDIYPLSIFDTDSWQTLLIDLPKILEVCHSYYYPNYFELSQKIKNPVTSLIAYLGWFLTHQSEKGQIPINETAGIVAKLTKEQLEELDNGFQDIISILEANLGGKLGVKAALGFGSNFDIAGRILGFFKPRNSFGKLLLLLGRGILNNHDASKIINVVRCMVNMAEVYRSEYNEFLKSKSEKFTSEKFVKECNEFLFVLHDTFAGVVKEAQKNPVENAALMSVKENLDKFTIDPQNSNFMFQLFEKLISPILKDALAIPDEDYRAMNECGPKKVFFRTI